MCSTVSIVFVPLHGSVHFDTETQLLNCLPVLNSSQLRCMLLLATHICIVITDVNCEWSQWSSWSSCSQQCDVSQRTRTRQCLTPPCTEDAEEIENCLRENCPGEWTNEILILLLQTTIASGHRGLNGQTVHSNAMSVREIELAISVNLCFSGDLPFFTLC